MIDHFQSLFLDWLIESEIGTQISMPPVVTIIVCIDLSMKHSDHHSLYINNKRSITDIDLLFIYLLRLPGSMYAMQIRNPGPMNFNNFLNENTILG